MRVFVFGTGRCGTVTIAKALAHCTNYTVAHETECRDWDWPDNHIEVNPQLRVVGISLPALYHGAWYVWLERNAQAVAASYARLDNGAWLTAWWSFHNTVRPLDDKSAAWFPVNQFLRQCEELYLAAPPERRMRLSIGGPERDTQFRELWERIGCEGDYTAALEEYSIRHNSSVERGDA